MTTNLKNKAYEIVEKMLANTHLPLSLKTPDYAVIYNALAEIEPLSDRDRELEDLWAQLEDVPMDPETEKLEEDFYPDNRACFFSAGTDREDIWHWFDERHSKGIAYLLYNDGVDRTPELANQMYLKQLCFDCESSSCQYNHGGECRFALVHERKPRINDYDGCIDYDYQEGEC